MLIWFNDEWRCLSLGSASGFINYYHSVSLWNLLHLTMVSSVDVHCKRDSLGLFSHLDVSHNELLSEINLSWPRLSAFGLESGKCKQNNFWLKHELGSADYGVGIKHGLKYQHKNTVHTKLHRVGIKCRLRYKTWTAAYNCVLPTAD